MGRNGVMLLMSESSLRRRLSRRINADREFHVVAKTDDPAAAESALASKRVGFAVLDLDHPSAISMVAAARAKDAEAVVLARSSMDPAICGALAAGAHGCLLVAD